MLSRFEKLRLIKSAIIITVYIISFTLYFMFKEMKKKAIAALPKFHFFNQVADHQINNSTIASHIFIDGSSPIPKEIVTAAIKLSLPIIRYEDFHELMKIETKSIVIQHDSNGSCVVCWERVELSDEIRDLVNCRHVFHKDCLDNWLDEGQITCPICRSMLLPPFINPWTVVLESNSSMERSDSL
ncbi:E3 ubiquitin-protein ligase RHA1B-like [Impatiens glandulifera]|uniref:E3 ubiquitin-protein ligase RHA1B-like n=1 Tax=Impatiens glandulifera TaxID=253017 RepID=UPI001FB18518|nr:E3 ubiquitin-protein ligase RHA1B-like [Impatiens glandulifera]